MQFLWAFGTFGTAWVWLEAGISFPGPSVMLACIGQALDLLQSWLKACPRVQRRIGRGREVSGSCRSGPLGPFGPREFVLPGLAGPEDVR